MKLIRTLGVAAVLIAVPLLPAQQSLFGTNLIVNGGADAGLPGTSLSSFAATVPGWTRTGNANVLSYSLPGLLPSTSPAPPDHSFQYFVAGSGSSTFSQDIDVSAAASVIAAGNVKFTASAYLGGANPPCNSTPAQVTIAFKNATGQTFNTIPLTGNAYTTALFLQQQIGLVPAGTARITVTITLTEDGNYYCGAQFAAADSLSLVLTALGTNPATVLGPNLIANPGGEAGPASPPH